MKLYQLVKLINGKRVVLDLKPEYREADPEESDESLKKIMEERPRVN